MNTRPPYEELLQRVRELETGAVNRDRAEKALRKERDFIAAVLSTAGALVVVLDREGRVVRFNWACEQLTGYSFEEIRGKPFWEVLLIPGEVEPVKDVFAELRSGQFPNRHKNYWVGKDGRRHLIKWSNTALLSNNGTVEHVIGTGIDITRRKNTEDALRKLSQAVAQSPAGVVITDANGNVEYVNPKFVEMTCYPEEEAVGKTPRILKSGEHSYEFYQELWRTITSGREWRGEFYNKKKTGEFYWESASISSIKTEEGAITHFVGVKEDITERKQAEEALRKAHEELEKRVAERSAELRQVSSRLLDAHEEERRLIALDLHDGLGQSLSAMKFRLESILQEMKEDVGGTCARSLQSVVPMVQEAFEEVRRITRNLRPSVLDDLGILATISWFCREFESTYKGVSIATRIDVREDDVPDALKIVIYRILQEALNNISKHSKADRVSLSLTKHDRNVILTVEDNGTGFDLEPLVSGKRMVASLGLAGMKERAALSGGSFSIESRSGAGTTICATWPC
jgi:PAS domain S-box-containing protein